jgi:hypothetical protein
MEKKNIFICKHNSQKLNSRLAPHYWVDILSAYIMTTLNMIRTVLIAPSKLQYSSGHVDVALITGHCAQWASPIMKTERVIMMYLLFTSKWFGGMWRGLWTVKLLFLWYSLMRPTQPHWAQSHGLLWIFHPKMYPRYLPPLVPHLLMIQIPCNKVLI